MTADTHTPTVSMTPWDIPALAAQWRGARPFSHVVIDNFLSRDALAAVTAAVTREPYTLEIGEISEGLMSASPPVDPTLRAFAAAVGGADALHAVRAITGKPVSSFGRIRSYLYQPGHFLLPHVDDPYEEGRLVALAFYTAPFGPCRGGELELFDTTVVARAITHAAPAHRIEPCANRLILFDSDDGTLHQVREVTKGTRAAFSGWFLR
jgi:hypothetical protein